MNAATYAAIEADLMGLRVPLDPEDLDRIPPEDLDACSRCSGTGCLPSPDGDPQKTTDCPVCAGEGILPEVPVLLGLTAVPLSRRAVSMITADICTCVYSCADHPATACSLSGTWHVHPDDGTGAFGPCPEHPDAPGDL